MTAILSGSAVIWGETGTSIERRVSHLMSARSFFGCDAPAYAGLTYPTAVSAAARIAKDVTAGMASTFATRRFRRASREASRRGNGKARGSTRQREGERSEHVRYTRHGGRRQPIYARLGERVRSLGWLRFPPLFGQVAKRGFW